MLSLIIRKKGKWFFFLAVSSFGIPLSSLASSLVPIATQGYIYGFPLVLMGATLEGFTGADRVCGLGTDINTLAQLYELPDADFKAVVRPNVDTLYSSAMLDLRDGPQLLYMPAVSDRYVLFALLDAWSNNFAGVGTQSHGDQEGFYVIVGPDWKGDLPPNYTRIDAPTNLVWIVGRTEVQGDDDIATVNEIQRKFTLTPWAHETHVSESSHCLPASEKTPPIDVVKSLSAEEYFSRLSKLMILNPPPEEDAELVAQLAKIGVGPQANKTVAELNRIEKAKLNLGRRFGLSSLDFATNLLGLGGWAPNPAVIPLGDYGKQYFIRAVVAQVGFGANRGEFAVYQNVTRDSSRLRLSGDNDYQITFAADALPPVNAFWSLTVYGEDGFLRDNEAAEQLGFTRSALGSNSGLVANNDGSLTIYLSTTPQEGLPVANWLPIPDGKFQVTIRLYDPDPLILNNKWKVPEIERREK